MAAAWFKRSLLALASVLAGLAASEGLVRACADVPAVRPIWFTQDDSVYRRSTNPVLSFELKPSYRNPSPDRTRNYERTNAHGLRDRERSLEKPPGTRRVLLLGDSVVEGYGLGEEHTLSRQLEQRLGGGVEVLNFGVSGYCTLAEVELLEVKGLAFDPDVVVLLFVENDFRNFNAETFDLGGTVEQPAWAKQLFLRSELFRHLCLRFDWLGFGAQVDPLGRNKRALAGDNNVVQGLARLERLAASAGFEAVVAIWPRFEAAGIFDMDPVPGTSELPIESLAWERGIPTARLSQYFRQHLADNPGSEAARARYTQGDTMHPSILGSQVAAAALADILARLARGELAAGVSTAGAAARSVAQSLSQVGGDYAATHNERGADAMQAGRIEEAIAHFEAALAEDPSYAEAHFNLGLVRYQRQELALAAVHFERAAAAWPDRAAPRSYLGVVLALQGDVEEGIRWLEQAVQLEPNNLEARNNLEHALKLKGGG